MTKWILFIFVSTPNGVTSTQIGYVHEWECQEAEVYLHMQYRDKPGTVVKTRCEETSIYLKRKRQ